MRLAYYPDTDSLYIDLSSAPGATAIEIAPGVVLDLDEHGKPVGIDIQRASVVADLTKVEVTGLPYPPGQGPAR